MKSPRQNKLSEKPDKRQLPSSAPCGWRGFLRAKLSLAGKILLHALGVAAVILGLALIFRDYIAKISFPAVASWYLGVDVLFDDITTTVDGKVKVYNLRVANPEGYTTKNILEADEVFIDVRLKSLFSGELVLESVTAENIRITPELNDRGRFNLAQLNDELQKHLEMRKDSRESSLRIDHLKCDGRITLLISQVEVPLYTEFDFEQKDLVIGGSHESFIEKFGLQNHVARTMLPPLCSWALGLPTTIGDVKLSLNGEVELYDIAIANPPVFQNRDVLRVKHLYLAADPGEVSGSKIIIKELLLDGAEGSAEFDSQERFNLQVIAEQILQRFPPEEPRQKSKGTIVECFSCDLKLWIKTPKDSMMQTRIKVGPRRLFLEGGETTVPEDLVYYSREMAKKLRVFTPGDLLKIAAKELSDIMSKAIKLPIFPSKK